MSFIRAIIPTVRIEYWSTIQSSNPFMAPEVKDVCIRGKVYGHPSKADGIIVKTSRIQSVSGNTVCTLNTIYELGEPDPEFIKWMKAEGISFNPEEPIKIIMK